MIARNIVSFDHWHPDIVMQQISEQSTAQLFKINQSVAFVYNTLNTGQAN